MIALLLALQVAAVDSIYASPALRALVEDATRLNRRVPATLAGYRATAEGEIAIVARRAEGHEGAVSTEQTQNVVRWSRDGAFEQRVTGYRSQAIGLQLSTLSFLRQAWAVPVLYGNRLTLLFGRDTTARAARNQRRGQRLVAVHPLAEDRERVYRYQGGDTVATLRVDGRTIPIVRVLVEPRADAPDSTVAFRGELAVDASRHVLVRMRGHFVRKAPPPGLTARLLSAVGGFEAVAFVELENGEIEGEYWLPTYQRIEAQAALTGATDARSIFRIVTRFRDHRVHRGDSAQLAQGDSLAPRHFALTVAPPESLATTAGWRSELGSATSAVHSDDFNDVAPEVWRPTGGPRLQWRTQRFMDVVRANRIEGLFTGYGAELRMRDAAPGLTLRATAGWAWSEQVARGRVSAEWKRGATTYLARAGRSLDLTNDFRSVFDSGSAVGLLFGVDDYDYVDRRLGAVGLWRQLGRGRTAILRLETGPARDAGVARALTRGVLRGDSALRENRGVRDGSYWRHWASLEWHPDVSAEFVRTGVGGLLSVEAARGTLEYTRLEARLMARRNAGPLTLAARADAGALLGDAPPPQQLFELGRNQNLPGYDYKEFAGTEAAVVRTLAMYRLGFWRTPIRVRRWFLPAIAPALALGVQGGWTQVRGAGGERALRELGVVRPASAALHVADVAGAVVGAPIARASLPAQAVGRDAGRTGANRDAAGVADALRADEVLRPVSRATDGVRTTVTVGVRLFGGALGVGVARAVDRPAPWRVVFDLSQGQ